jgi:ubiquinol-cytochrome c reductase iron-sulfur subunit
MAEPWTMLSSEDQPEELVTDPHLKVPTKYERYVQRLIAVCFLAGIAAAGGFVTAYWYNVGPILEGGLFAATCALIGLGVTAWGKYLMIKGPFVEPRERIESSEEDRRAAVGSLERGLGELRRRSFLTKTLGVGAAALGIASAFPLLRSLGPMPGKSLFKTKWRKGSLVVQLDGTPVRANDLEVGGVMTVFPQGDEGSAISQTLLIRAASEPFTTKPGRETWTPLGYVAYSKVCTHAGCPVALYMEETQQLLCPCHQSLFNVLDGAMPIFGPAPRPLPQLPLYVDKEGFLRAQAGYDEPIGPGFWERE